VKDIPTTLEMRLAIKTLSEAVQKPFCDKLQQMGIATTRLTAKGHGMSKPMDSNETAEAELKTAGWNL
jgi:hypothetical protein